MRRTSSKEELHDALEELSGEQHTDEDDETLYLDASEHAGAP